MHSHKILNKLYGIIFFSFFLCQYSPTLATNFQAEMDNEVLVKNTRESMLDPADKDKKKAARNEKLISSMTDQDLLDEIKLYTERVDKLTTDYEKRFIERFQGLIRWVNFHEVTHRALYTMSYITGAGAIGVYGASILSFSCDLKGILGIASGALGAGSAGFRYLAYQSEQAYLQRDKQIVDLFYEDKIYSGGLYQEAVKRGLKPAHNKYDPESNMLIPDDSASKTKKIKSSKKTKRPDGDENAEEDSEDNA